MIHTYCAQLSCCECSISDLNKRDYSFDKVQQHDYQMYCAINDIDHTKTKAASSQTNGICERFHKAILQEFYQVAFRKKIYTELETLHKDLDEWLIYYNNE
jgi:transposase InsO family protein